MRCRVDCEAKLAGRECDAVRVRACVRMLERGVLCALTLRPATSGTVYVTPVAGDEDTVGARDAVRRDPLALARGAGSASRFLDLELGVFAR